MSDYRELMPFLDRGMLVGLPSKKKKRLAALAWLAEHIPPEKCYTESEFDALLDRLHAFGDPAVLRRELCEVSLVSRTPDGSAYRLDPEGPSLEELLGKYCGVIPEPAPEPETPPGPFALSDVSDADLAHAAEFREQIHAEALAIVRRVRPETAEVADPYPVEAYFQRHWDYPGAWYTIVAIPGSAGSREALLDTIVRETLARSRKNAGTEQN